MPEGDSIVLLYLKLLLKAINTEGIIYYQHILPTLDEEIALDTGEKSALVKLTISALCQYHAAVFLDDQSLQLLYLEDMVGSESASASRVRNHRANQKLLKEKEQATLQCNATVTEGNTTEISGNPEIENSEKEEKKPKKDGNKSVLSGVPAALPSLIKAYRIQDKARNVGFDWEEKSQVWDKVFEEFGELKNEIENMDPDNMENEFGDLFFSLINAARLYDINPENALEHTNQKFIRRFNYLEQETLQKGKNLKDMSLAEMDAIWDEAKQKGL